MPIPRNVSGRYSFEGFTLDLDRGELSGPDGPRRLRRKSYEVLCHLVLHHGRLVTKADLLDVVWGRKVVSEGSLSQCLMEIRRALDDHDRRIIHTVAGRGFILDVPVVASPTATPADVSADRQRVVQRRRAFALGAALALAALAATWWYAERPGTSPGGASHVAPNEVRGSLAVLPFIDLSAGQDYQYFGDGIAEEVLNLLAQTRALKVIARTSSFAFKGGSADIPTIAAQLGVAHVLEGSVRVVADRVRVTAQLVDGHDGAHLWSAAYDRNLEDVLAVQTAIAAAVATVLKTTLLADDLAGGATDDPRAYEHVLRGRYLLHRRGPGDLARAEEHYRRAIELDPTAAHAWVGLAATYLIRIGDDGMPPEVGLPEGLRAVERALELEPNLPEAHLRAATLRAFNGEPEVATRHRELAAALDPDHPLLLGLLSGSALRAGDLAGAVELMGRAVATDPLNAVNRHNLGTLYLAAGHLPESRAELEAARELSPAPSLNSSDAFGRLLLLEGRSDEALLLAHAMPDSSQRDALLAMAGGELQYHDEADAAERRLRTAADSQAATQLAEVLAYRGSADEALAWLSEAAHRLTMESERPELAWQWAVGVHASPFMGPLRNHPQWRSVAPLLVLWEPSPDGD